MKTTIEQAAQEPNDSARNAGNDGFDDVLRALARAPSVRPADIDLVGRTVGRFVVQRRIGEGGMGVVYEAFDPVLARQVALKVLRAAHRESSATRVRLHEEARRVAALHHPHIATVYDVGEHDGIVFLALERVSGRPLRARLAAPAALPMPRSLAILRAIASGLSCAHGAGIIHRDLKPENVVVGDDGTVKIVDFGIATLAGESAAKNRGARPAGTRRYMAPEHAAGAPASTRADVFAFGVLAREVLAATFPRPHDRALRLALDRLFATCTAADPDRRPGDGAAVLAALEALASPPRRSAPVGALTLGAAALAAALGVVAARSTPPPAPTAAASVAGPLRPPSPAPPSPPTTLAAARTAADLAPPANMGDTRPAADEPASANDLFGLSTPLGGRPVTEQQLANGALEGDFVELTASQEDGTPGLPVTAFVDAQGRLVATVRLDTSSQAARGRGLTAGALAASASEAEVVGDGTGGTIIHVTLRLNAPSGGSGSSGGGSGSGHVLDQAGAPAGGVSAIVLDHGASQLLGDHIRPSGEGSPANPSMPNDKKMNLCAEGNPGSVRTLIGPDGELIVLGGDDDDQASALVVIDARGRVVSLGAGVTVCGSSHERPVTMDG